MKRKKPLTYHSDPEFCDVSPVHDTDSTAVPGSVVDSAHVPRPKRPSELPGASVEPAAGQYLTVHQAALELSVSPRRVRALISAGWLKGRHVNPRLILIRRQDLKAVRVRQSGRPVK